MTKTVTREPETLLVDLLLTFASPPRPDDPAAVEAHFRQHPWTSCWRTILADPHEQAVAAFRDDYDFARAEIARMVRTDGPARPALRKEMAGRLEAAVSENVDTVFGPMRVPLGALAIQYRRGALVLDFRPALTGVRAAVTYGLGLLLDTSREFGRALMGCQVCGAFFRRQRSRQAYCSRACLSQGAGERNRARQQRYRDKLERRRELERRQRKGV